MKIKKADIEVSLRAQLEGKCKGAIHFNDLVNDYMELWSIKKKLVADIKTRGIAYEEISSKGFEITKQNQSVKDLVTVNKQMLTLLKEMGLTTDGIAGDDDVL